MTDQSLPARATIETVVRSFSQSELALADVTNAIAKFQTATEQLASAEADATEASEGLKAATEGLKTVTEGLKAATEASERVAQQLQGLVAGLGEAVAVLRAVDPDRLWAHLGASDSRHEADTSRMIADEALVNRRLTLLIRVSSLGAVAAAAALAVVSLLAAGVL